MNVKVKKRLWMAPDGSGASAMFSLWTSEGEVGSWFVTLDAATAPRTNDGNHPPFPEVVEEEVVAIPALEREARMWEQQLRFEEAEHEMTRRVLLEAQEEDVMNRRDAYKRFGFWGFLYNWSPSWFRLHVPFLARKAGYIQ